MGTLITKIQCQLTAWVSRPPTSRPIDPPPTATKRYALMALARSAAPVNSVTMIATITEVEIAPPMPWKKRAVINIAWLWARAQTSDDVVKSATPLRNTFLRPKRSPKRPASSRKLPKAMR